MSLHVETDPAYGRSCGSDRCGPVAVLEGVFAAKWSVLLRVHRQRLPEREDLEDCLAQAAMELSAAAIAGRLCSEPSLVAVTLETRFLSRVIDRQRALAGRSAIRSAERQAVRIDRVAERVAARDEVLQQVVAREELAGLLGRVARLTRDQRLVIGHELFGRDGAGLAEFCARHGWTAAKYRKVAQRARARLR